MLSFTHGSSETFLLRGIVAPPRGYCGATARLINHVTSSGRPFDLNLAWNFERVKEFDLK